MILQGDCLAMLQTLEAESVQTCVTSPPYWGLRDYGVEGQIGLEPTPDAYVQKMVAVFQEVRRVLKADGTLWLNLGDTYNSGGGTTGGGKHAFSREPNYRQTIDSLKPKDLCGIPWRVAFALQADGWYLRSDIIWAKPNPMPESVTDRPTKAHEYIFLLSKNERYYYDAQAIKEEGVYFGKYKTPDGWDTSTGNGGHGGFHKNGREKGFKKSDKQRGHGRRHDGFNDRWDALPKELQCNMLRNKRSVWTIATQPYPDAHFATFPPKLIEPCILAGSRPGDTVLDPFAGSGTTLYVAKELNRQYVGIELNPAYIELIHQRLTQEVLPL